MSFRRSFKDKWEVATSASVTARIVKATDSTAMPPKEKHIACLLKLKSFDERLLFIQSPSFCIFTFCISRLTISNYGVHIP